MPGRIEENPDQKTDTGGRRHKRGTPQVIPVRYGKPRRSVPHAGRPQRLCPAPAGSVTFQLASAFQQCRGQLLQMFHFLPGDFNRGSIETRQALKRGWVNQQTNLARQVARRSAGQHLRKYGKTRIEFGEKGRQLGENRPQVDADQFDQAGLPPTRSLQPGAGQPEEALPKTAGLTDLKALRALGFEYLSEMGQLLNHFAVQYLKARLGCPLAQNRVPPRTVDVIQSRGQFSARLLDRSQVRQRPEKDGDQGVNHHPHHRFDGAKHGALEHVFRGIQIGQEDEETDVGGHGPQVGILLSAHHQVGGEEHPTARQEHEGPAFLRRQGLDDQGGEASEDRSHHAQRALADRGTDRGQRDHGHRPAGPVRVHPAELHRDAKDQGKGQARLNRFLELRDPAHLAVILPRSKTPGGAGEVLSLGIRD